MKKNLNFARVFRQSLLLLSFFALLNVLGSCHNDEVDLIAVQSGNTWGFIDLEGNYVINPQFDHAKHFTEGLAPVCQDNKWGYIDLSGKIVIPMQYKSVTSFSEEGLAFAVSPGGSPICINKKGEIVFKLDKDVKNIWKFEEGLARVEKGKKIGFVDKTGKYVISPQFDGAYYFCEGLASVLINNKWGFINKEGKIVINPQFDAVGIFKEGLAAVQHDKRFGYINKEGKYIINPQFDIAGIFKEGLAGVMHNKRFGYINKEGKYIINPQFDEASIFLNGLATIKQNEKWGIINQEGKIVVNPQFDYALPFRKNLFVVNSGEEIGFVDTEGKYVINPQFKDVHIPEIEKLLFYNELVISDYYDMTDIYNVVDKLCIGQKFDQLSYNATLNDLMSHSDYRHSAKEDGLYSVEVNEKKWTNEVTCQIRYVFDSEISSLDWNYYTYSYDRIYNKDAIISHAIYKLDVPTNRAETIANSLKQHIATKYNTSIKDDVIITEGGIGFRIYAEGGYVNIYVVYSKAGLHNLSNTNSEEDTITVDSVTAEN